MVSGGKHSVDYVVIPAVVVTNDGHHRGEVEDLINKGKPGSCWRGGGLGKARWKQVLSRGERSLGIGGPGTKSMELSNFLCGGRGEGLLLIKTLHGS